MCDASSSAPPLAARPATSRCRSMQWSKPAASTGMARAAAMRRVRSNGKPYLSCSTNASSPEIPAAPPRAAAASKCLTPRAHVRSNASSSDSSTVRASSAAPGARSSGNASPIVATTAGTSDEKKPTLAPRNCLPTRTARRTIRRSTYPRPTLSGLAPSTIEKTRVRMWSAMTLYATSSSLAPIPPG